MGARFIRMVVVFVMLFGSMLSPTLAHAGGPDFAPMFERAHVDVEFDHATAVDDHGSDTSPGENSGNILPHHHCTGNLALVVPEATLGVMPVLVTMFRPHRAAALASWQAALPSEPPAA